MASGKKTFCASNEEAPILLDAGFYYVETKPRCSKCDNRCYIRFADFEIAPKRAYYERKTAADFVASRKERLYLQLNRMDMFVEDGRKGLILEIVKIMELCIWGDCTRLTIQSAMIFLKSAMDGDDQMECLATGNLK